MALVLLLVMGCAVLLSYLVLLLRSFEYLSESELKRQARSGNKAAKKVYAVRGVYGFQVFVFIWALIGILNATIVILIESRFKSLLAVVFNLFTTVLVHAILPWSRYPKPSIDLAAQASPFLEWLMALTRPLYRVPERLVGAWVSGGDIHRIHSKEELLEMLERSDLDDGEVSKDEFRIATHALTFGDKTVGEIMTPRSVVRMLKSDEVLTPAALNELHESGFSRFPVLSTVDGSVAGMLYMKDVVGLKTNKLIRDVMREEVFYVNEFNSLDHVLNAFLRSKHHLFMVVNEYEEISGIITIEDVIEQIIGKKIVDEFDQYADLRAVASQRARMTSKERANV